MRKPLIVAEIGCNHQGDFEIAKRMVRVAADFCGVDFVKFQKRDIEAIEDKTHLHPNPSMSFGRTYYEHRKALEFSVEQHAELRDLSASLGVGYACSVFDLQSLKDIISLSPDYLKFGSAVNQSFDLLGYAFENWTGPIHISLGMLKKEGRADLMSFLRERRSIHSVVLYHCVTAYPTPAVQACIREIVNLVNGLGGMYNDVGYSGHHQGVALDIAAFALGANWIERHFTLDRTWKGTDHVAALEPDGLRKVVKYLLDTALALTEKPRGGLVECELENYNKFKLEG